MSTRPTIGDIASLAGVSKATVSFALNSPTRISEETYKRIMDIVQKLDYVPNPVARTLASKKLGALGLLLPQPIEEVLLNPYFVELVRGIGEVCSAHDLSLTMLPPIKGRIIEAARRAIVDGLVAIGVGPTHEVVELLNKRHIPFVTVDGAIDDATVNIGIDNEYAAYGMMRHILSMGHRSITILELMPEKINFPNDRFSLVRDQRLAGFSRALGEVSLSLSSTSIRVIPAESSFAGGETAIDPLLVRGASGKMPTAVVAMADAIALGVYESCRRAGLSIPEDLSVAGFDDIPDAARAAPPLTTIRQPSREKGAMAAAQVILQLDGKPAGHRLLPTELIVRGSTGIPRKDQ